MLAAQLAAGLLDGPLFDAPAAPCSSATWHRRRSCGPARRVTARSRVWSACSSNEARHDGVRDAAVVERQARALCESASCAAGVTLSPLADAPVAGRCEPSGSAVAAPRPPTAPRSRVRSRRRGAGSARRWRPAAPPVPVHRERLACGGEARGVRHPGGGCVRRDGGGVAAGAPPRVWSITDQMSLPGSADVVDPAHRAGVGRRLCGVARRGLPRARGSVLASGLGRSIGVVCFHPKYEIPSQKFLARRPFGHMRSTEKLRRWLERTRTLPSDDEIARAGAAMRHSPRRSTCCGRRSSRRPRTQERPAVQRQRAAAARLATWRLTW